MEVFHILDSATRTGVVQLGAWHIADFSPVSHIPVFLIVASIQLCQCRFALFHPPAVPLDSAIYS